MALRRGGAGLVAVAIVAAAPSAQAEVDRQLQLWDSVSITGDLSPGKDGAVIWFDGHLRRGDAGAVVLARPGVGYRITPTWSVWAGYAWTPSFTDGGGRRDEHRGWQQVLGSSKHGTLAWSVRSRLEQRLGEGDQLGLRLRQQARAAWTPEGSPLSLVIWDEVFVAFDDTDWGQRAGFDQNRAFVGVSAPLGAGGARIEAGYLFAHLSRDVDVQIHALAVALALPLSR